MGQQVAREIAGGLDGLRVQGGVQDDFFGPLRQRLGGQRADASGDGQQLEHLAAVERGKLDHGGSLLGGV